MFLRHIIFFFPKVDTPWGNTNNFSFQSSSTQKESRPLWPEQKNHLFRAVWRSTASSKGKINAELSLPDFVSLLNTAYRYGKNILINDVPKQKNRVFHFSPKRLPTPSILETIKQWQRWTEDPKPFLLWGPCSTPAALALPCRVSFRLLSFCPPT